MVPNGWEIKTLDAAKVVVTDGDRGKEYPKSSDFSEDGYCLFLSAKNVTKRGFSFSEKQFISKDKHEKLRKGLVNRGDIVLTTRGTVGQFSFYDESITYEPIRINSGMVTLNFTNADIKNDFFYALSKSSIIKKQIDLAAFGSAQPQLTVKIIKSLKLPVPPLPEQRKIAQILSTWDKAITTTEQLLVNSQQQKKALMQQLLTGKKRLLDDNGIRFSGEWKKLKLKKLFDFKRGKGLSKSAIKKDGQKKCILYGELFTCYPEVISNVLSRTNEGDSILSVKGDILIPSSTTTSGVDLANATALLESGVLLGGDINILRPKEKLSSRFFAYLLTHIEKYQIASFAQGITIIHIYGADLKKVEVKVPLSISEQQKIAAVLISADHEIDSLQQKIEALKQEKKALMQQLLTGKRRVKIN